VKKAANKVIQETIKPCLCLCLIYYSVKVQENWTKKEASLRLQSFEF